jgi:very-short-patch-repair endonuclease
MNASMSTTGLQRALRKKSIWAEKKLWSVLRDRRFSAYKFRRQQDKGPWILDFYCAEARYCLELDGGQHGFPEQMARDAERDAYLASRNIQTRRFWNHELENIQFVRDTIWADLQARAPHLGNVKPEQPVKLPKRPIHPLQGKDGEPKQ